MFLFIRAKCGTSESADNNFVLPIFDSSITCTDFFDLLAIQIEKLIPQFNSTEQSVVIDTISICKDSTNYSIDNQSSIPLSTILNGTLHLLVNFTITFKQLRQTQSQIYQLPSLIQRSKYFMQEEDALEISPIVAAPVTMEDQEGIISSEDSKKETIPKDDDNNFIEWIGKRKRPIELKQRPQQTNIDSITSTDPTIDTSSSSAMIILKAKQPLVHESVIAFKRQCKICKKWFSMDYLNQHIETVHNNERNWRCKLCGFSFKRKHHLKDHIKSRH